MRPLPLVVLSLLLASASLAELPDLKISTTVPASVTPGLGFTIPVIYENVSLAGAEGATITVFASTWINHAPDFCDTERNRAICRVGAIRAGERKSFDVEIRAHEQVSREFDTTLSIAANEGDANASNDVFVATTKTSAAFFVTNTNDSGSGSFRAAIEDANAACRFSGCTIAFRIPSTMQAWHTIRLQSPLPVVIAKVSIDGRTQTAFGGDTNSLGPEIELNGAALTFGDGLELTCGSVNGLAVNGFPGNGFKLGAFSPPCDTTLTRYVTDCYIGTDPTGSQAVPNHRGIAVDGGLSFIENNVISGNRRSGVFVERGEVEITGNTIGMNAARTGPLSNGASGIYFDVGAGDIANNFIAFNHHFGVAMSSRASFVALSGNSFQANHQTAIDYGLDGITTASPEIIAARYENGSTIIEIEPLSVDTNWRSHVSVYANDAPDPSGYGEGQYYLGTVEASAQRVTFVHAGDLRGKWISATHTTRRPNSIFSTHGTRNYFFTNTSEFSRAVEVK